MSLFIRAMQADEADAVAAMVQGLADFVGRNLKTGLTGAKLNAARDLVDVTVAEDGGHLLGACLTLMTYSTWRGQRGLYVVDLFVEPHARNRNVGLDLLRQAARRGAERGACFIKLEVDTVNTGAARFYERLGFAKKDEDRLFVLEQNDFDKFLLSEER